MFWPSSYNKPVRQNDDDDGTCRYTRAEFLVSILMVRHIIFVFFFFFMCVAVRYYKRFTFRIAVIARVGRLSLYRRCRNVRIIHLRRRYNFDGLRYFAIESRLIGGLEYCNANEHKAPAVQENAYIRTKSEVIAKILKHKNDSCIIIWPC